MGKRIDFGPFVFSKEELKLVAGRIYIVRKKGFPDLSYLFCDPIRAIRIDGVGRVYFDDLCYYKSHYEIVADVTGRISLSLE